MNKISRRRFLQLAGLAGATGLAFPSKGNAVELLADCIHAWPHPAVEMAYNAFFAGLPFGAVLSSVPTQNHWLLGQAVDCRMTGEGDCPRFGPSPLRVAAATFKVNWITSRVDVFGRRYTVISNLAQTNLAPYPDP
ncbi:MAG: twin-arginine translocation signal domain-containing protein [Burkholderiales bacterium]